MLSKLVEDFFNMKEEILSRDFDLGFSGNSEDVVMRALHLLGNCVNVTSSSNRNGEFTIAPSQTVPALFELNFYSNGLFHVFISDAIIGVLSQEIVVVFRAHHLSLTSLLMCCRSSFPILNFLAQEFYFSDASPACSILSLQRELVVESESDQPADGPSSLPLSQERLIRKAAGLSHFLVNEVSVAPVSPTHFPHLFALCTVQNKKCTSLLSLK